MVPPTSGGSSLREALLAAGNDESKSPSDSEPSRQRSQRSPPGKREGGGPDASSRRSGAADDDDGATMAMVTSSSPPAGPVSPRGRRGRGGGGRGERGAAGRGGGGGGGKGGDGGRGGGRRRNNRKQRHHHHNNNNQRQQHDRHRHQQHRPQRDQDHDLGRTEAGIAQNGGNAGKGGAGGGGGGRGKQRSGNRPRKRNDRNHNNRKKKRNRGGGGGGCDRNDAGGQAAGGGKSSPPPPCAAAVAASASHSGDDDDDEGGDGGSGARSACRACHSDDGDRRDRYDAPPDDDGPDDDDSASSGSNSGSPYSGTGGDLGIEMTLSPLAGSGGSYSSGGDGSLSSEKKRPLPLGVELHEVVRNVGRRRGVATSSGPIGEDGGGGETAGAAAEEKKERGGKKKGRKVSGGGGCAGTDHLADTSTALPGEDDDCHYYRARHSTAAFPALPADWRRRQRRRPKKKRSRSSSEVVDATGSMTGRQHAAGERSSSPRVASRRSDGGNDSPGHRVPLQLLLGPDLRNERVGNDGAARKGEGGAKGGGGLARPTTLDREAMVALLTAHRPATATTDELAAAAAAELSAVRAELDRTEAEIESIERDRLRLERRFLSACGVGWRGDPAWSLDDVDDIDGAVGSVDPLLPSREWDVDLLLLLDAAAQGPSSSSAVAAAADPPSFGRKGGGAKSRRGGGGGGGRGGWYGRFKSRRGIGGGGGGSGDASGADDADSGGPHGLIGGERRYLQRSRGTCLTAHLNDERARDAFLAALCPKEEEEGGRRRRRQQQQRDGGGGGSADGLGTASVDSLVVESPPLTASGSSSLARRIVADHLGTMTVSPNPSPEKKGGKKGGGGSGRNAKSSAAAALTSTASKVVMVTGCGNVRGVFLVADAIDGGTKTSTSSSSCREPQADATGSRKRTCRSTDVGFWVGKDDGGAACHGGLPARLRERLARERRIGSHHHRSGRGQGRGRGGGGDGGMISSVSGTLPLSGGGGRSSSGSIAVDGGGSGFSHSHIRYLSSGPLGSYYVELASGERWWGLGGTDAAANSEAFSRALGWLDARRVVFGPPVQDVADDRNDEDDGHMCSSNDCEANEDGSATTPSSAAEAAAATKIPSKAGAVSVPWIILGRDGRSAWSRSGIPLRLHNVLSRRPPDRAAPAEVSLGLGGSYFVRFLDGEAEYSLSAPAAQVCGQIERRGGTITNILLHAESYDYVVRHTELHD